MTNNNKEYVCPICGSELYLSFPGDVGCRGYVDVIDGTLMDYEVESIIEVYPDEGFFYCDMNVNHKIPKELEDKLYKNMRG
jgi:hypothetical protein